MRGGAEAVYRLTAVADRLSEGIRGFCDWPGTFRQTRWRRTLVPSRDFEASRALVAMASDPGGRPQVVFDERASLGDPSEASPGDYSGQPV